MEPYQFTGNYHTHTWRCNHATGTEREYIENAIRYGLKTLGFSDHTPYPFPGGYVSGFRMKVEQLEDYVQTVLALKEEYRSDLKIYLGVEAEYYPAYFDGLLELLGQYPIDYMLLGQHLTNNETDGYPCGYPTTDSEHLKRYVSQTCEAMETGKFLYFAHPDLLFYNGDDRELYEREMRKLCRKAKSLHVPLEINLHGMWQKRFYPNPVFWKIAGEEGNAVVLGSDAHHADRIYPEEEVAEALQMAETFHLRLVDPMEFVEIR